VATPTQLPRDFSFHEAQDGRLTVPESRRMMAERFRISEQLVRRIEQEGLEAEWPPLT